MSITETDIKIDGVTYEVEYEIEPAQNGGMIDDSWEAHVIELAVMLDGKRLNEDDVCDDENYGLDNAWLYREVEKQLNIKLSRGW